MNVKKRSGKLYIDYYIADRRVRKSTGLDDTTKNRLLIKKEIIPKIQAKILLGEYGKKRAKRLFEYAKRYLVSKEDLISYDVKSSRVEKIIKSLGNVYVDRITRSHIKDFLAEYKVKPYTAKEYLTEIRGILDIALDDEVIQVNQARSIRLGKLGKPEIDPFSAEEVQSIMKSSQGMFRNYLGIAFNTGLRSGEVLGLMHSDVDKMLSIKRTVTRGRVKEPKTLGSIRNIPIFDVTKPFLEKQMQENQTLFLFQKDGENLGDIDYFRRQWKTVLKNAGVRYRKLYNTRHTFITAMLNSGQFSILQIAQMVGHASPRMIMSTYAGFVQSEHLKIDVKTNLFGHNMGTVEKQVKSYEFDKSSRSS